MNTKFYLVFVLTIITGAISLSFKNSPSSRCEMFDLAKPGGGAFVTNQGLTGASWDNAGRTCSRCHSGGGFDASTSISLLSGSNPVTQYTPGANYTLQLKVTSNSGNPSYGFCLMAATTSDNTDINTWGTIPTGARKNTVLSRHYIEQTSARTATSTSPTSSYTIDVPWTAPASGTGNISFYASGLAVNNNNSTGGDSPTPGTNITVSESATTPISFSSVSAILKNNQADVAWTTESETTTAYFSVEHSADGIQFTSKGNVNGRNSNSKSNYTFTDKSISKGNNFYRIVAVDLSGAKLISKTVEVSSSKNNFSLSPNPVRHNLFLSGANLNGNSYRIFNMKGQQIAKGKIQSNEINTQSLAPGSYTISVTDKSGSIQTKQFIKE